MIIINIDKQEKIYFTKSLTIIKGEAFKIISTRKMRYIDNLNYDLKSYSF